MTPNRLLYHFDRISEAPDAIPRLRRFIRDLAVRGKLVEQDPNDEPASELLKRIQAEKARLLKEGKIRSPRVLEDSDDEDKLFRLPSLWTWCRLSEVGAIVGGGTPPSADADNFTSGGSGTAWLTPADLGKHTGLYVFHGARDLTQQGLRSSSATLMPKGSVLFTSRAPIGYTAIAANEVSTNQGFKSVVPYILTCNLYIAVYFRAFGRWIDGKASGTTFREVSGKIVASLPFPLPPLAEQHRIVAKVDELMALCDRLEASQAERESRRDRLAAASLHRLNNGADVESFREHARFHFGHLPRLTTHPEHIQQLRQTILNLAVGGKLVRQDPKDEPATELLKQIQREKNRLVQEGKIGKEKLLPKVRESDLPFALPDTWTWVRLGTICQLVTSGSRDWAKFYSVKGAIFLRMGNLSRGSYRLRLDNVQRVTAPADSEGARTKLQEGDILISITGDVGMLGLIPLNFGEAYINQHTCVVRLMDQLRNRYLPELFRSPFAQSQFNEPQRGIKNSFRLTDVTQFLVPLPPLVEQHRIVAKVEELLALCDRLETQLTTSQTESRRLLEAVLAEVLAT